MLKLFSRFRKATGGFPTASLGLPTQTIFQGRMLYQLPNGSWVEGFIPLNASGDVTSGGGGGGGDASAANQSTEITRLTSILAKLAAFGVAGTASADVITIQGIAGMTKLLVTPDLPTGAATSAKQDTLDADLLAILGATNGAAVTTDASGTLQQFARGLVTIFGAVTGSPVANTIGDRLKVMSAALAGTLNVFITNAANVLNMVYSATPEASHVIVGSAHTPMLVYGYNSGPKQYILLFDQASVPANSANIDATPPRAILPVPADSAFSFDPTALGIPFANGICICNSTSAPVAATHFQKTLGAADCLFAVGYL